MTVPRQYEGLWRRKGIWRRDGSSDLSTQVWWFQSPRFHIDLRIPADRPAVRRHAQLAGLEPHQVARFRAQTGFAGLTVVDGERCEWQPEIAFPALGDELDAGWMRFDGDNALHEAGIDGGYDEEWVREPAGAMRGVRLQDKQSDAVAYLLVGATWMAWACGRPGDRFDGAWSEFTVLRKADGWQVAASNFPWLEAQPAVGAVALEADRIAGWKVGELVLIPFAPRQWWRVTDID